MMKSMSIGCPYILGFIFFSLRTSNTQYLPVIRNPSKANTCDGPNRTALVEQFFNVIFTEFHNSPPVCVCVQMCTNQPTYCYPNGCLKKVDAKKKTAEDRPATAPISNIQSVDSINKMFLVDDKNYFTNMLNDNVESKALPVKRPAVQDMRPDPFKDRYKILFKFKKMPKVEMRYNLREQVKNMKSDILKVETKDVSKTRWPNPSNHLIFNDNQLTKANEKKNDRTIVGADNGETKFFVSNTDSFTSRYFKRDLRRNHKDDIGVEDDYLSDNADSLDNKNFSIETLLEKLIGNNFEGKRDTNVESNTHLNESKENSSNVFVSPSENATKSNISKVNEQTCVVSMNMTNQNLDENKYIEDSPLVKERMIKWENYTFNQMIAALAKRIEKQNNTSMEILMQGSANDKSNNETNPTTLDDDLRSANKTSLIKRLTDDIQTVIITKNTEIDNVPQESHQKGMQKN